MILNISAWVGRRAYSCRLPSPGLPPEQLIDQVAGLRRIEFSQSNAEHFHGGGFHLGSVRVVLPDDPVD